MFARLHLAALAVAIVSLVTPSPLIPRAPTCARNYTVTPNDMICNIISTSQNVSTYQLATVNKDIIDSFCGNLFVGEVLCLGLAGQDCTTVHVVAPGDICLLIAANAGTTFETLRVNNPNIDENCTNIYPGEVLCTATTPVYT